MLPVWVVPNRSNGGKTVDTLGSSVWDRTGQSEMSKNLYALLICFWTAVGIGGSAVAAQVAKDWSLTWTFFIGVFVVSIAGIFVAHKSENPLVSLLGYAMIAIPFGLMLGPVVAVYTTASVVKVLFLTTAMVVVLGIVGAVIPDSLDSWQGPLLGLLLLLLLGYLIVPIAGFFGIPITTAMTMLDWAGVLLFGVLVVFDLNRAMRIPWTMDNSIDSAIGIYLDFINIFIRLLSLSGKKKND